MAAVARAWEEGGGVSRAADARLGARRRGHPSPRLRSGEEPRGDSRGQRTPDEPQQGLPFARPGEQQLKARALARRWMQTLTQGTLAEQQFRPSGDPRSSGRCGRVYKKLVPGKM